MKLLPKIDEDGIKPFFKDLLFCIVGTFLFAFSIHFFTAPNQIAPGGVTGISTILNSLFGLPIGLMTSIINIPIMIIGFIHLGKRFMVKTIVCILSFTFFTDVLLKNFPTYTNERVVAAVFGGVVMGIGLGIIFSHGGSTGGSDIINKIIGKRLPHMKLGKITFISDLVVVAISGFAYRSIEPALFALICLYISSIAVDAVLYGLNVCKFIYIISNKADDISSCIISEMHRGATIMRSYGAFTKEDRPTCMVAVRQNEYYRLKKIVNSIDPSAFMIVTTANEIVGSGFSKLD